MYPEEGQEARIDSRDYLVFFLKKKEDVALTTEEKLKYSLVQEFDPEKEKRIKVKIGSYSEIGSSLEPEREKISKSGAAAAKSSTQVDQPQI